MKRLLVTVALALLAVPSYAAIQYEFSQKNITGDAVTPATDLTARAIVDGQSSRVEFLGGNLYPPGTYVISTDGFRNLYFVDPEKKWYTEVNTSSITAALGGGSITIVNFKSDVKKLDDQQVIAGVPTDHYRDTMSYDITLMMKTIPLKQHVRTDIDTWTTTQFGTVNASFLGNAARTGNTQLDQLIETETTRVPGFPLRHQVSIKTSYNAPARTNLQRPTSKSITRETWVTSIRETTATPGLFTFPATYRRADQPDLPQTGPATQTVTFEPTGGT